MPNPIAYHVLFNNTDLAAAVPGLQVYSVDPFQQPHRTLSIGILARRAARKVSATQYDSRMISVSCWLDLPTRALLEQSLDTLHSLIQTLEGSLIVPQSGGVRQYTATFSTETNNSPNAGASSNPAPQGGFIDLTLNFECSDSYGYDPTYTIITKQNALLSGGVNTRYTQGGGADAQVPFFQAQYTAITGGTNATVTVGNLNTAAAIVVTRTWQQYDILQIDCLNRTVQVNGLDVVFTGGFPEMGLGLQTVTYADTFTTRTFNWFVYVYNRYN